MKNVGRKGYRVQGTGCRVQSVFGKRERAGELASQATRTTASKRAVGPEAGSVNHEGVQRATCNVLQFGAKSSVFAACRSVCP
jgi:hypothetical protein